MAGGAARLILNGVAVIEVRSNPGSAPVVQVRGSVIVAPVTVSGTKTYTNDDSQRLQPDQHVDPDVQRDGELRGRLQPQCLPGHWHDHDRWCDEQLHDHGAGGRDIIKPAAKVLAVGKTDVVVLSA